MWKTIETLGISKEMHKKQLDQLQKDGWQESDIKGDFGEGSDG